MCEERLQSCLSLLLAVLAGCQALPAPLPAEPGAGMPPVVLPASAETRAVPISLDTVLRLAQDQNRQIQLAQARLQEAFADQALAQRRHWLPDVYLGAGYYRHEGGIQDFQGNLIHSSYGSILSGVELTGKLDPREKLLARVEAERSIWQQRGELSKLTSENLLDAATTYIDLLAARAGEAVGRDAERRLARLLDETRKLTEVEAGMSVELSRVEMEVAAQQALTRKLAAGARSAAARLAYLLGLDPACDLVVVEQQLMPIALVDASQPLPALVEQAFAQGPGVRELEGLLRVVEEARTRAEGPQRFWPALELNMVDGAFGAGPGAQLAWDNRWDMGLRFRWNVSDAFTARERRQQADAKMRQAHLSYQDLRAKLTLGVREAREASLSGAEQVPLSQRRIQHAEQAHAQSLSRWQQGIRGRTPSELLLSIRSLSGSRLEYVQTVRDLDKAQLRLLLLTGSAERLNDCGSHP